MDFDSLLNAADQAGLPGKMNQDNSELIDDVTKLLRLTEMLVSLMPNFIVEVHITPMDILQIKMKDLDSIGFYIVYMDTQQEDLSELKSTCDEYICSLMAGEFEHLPKMQPTMFITKMNFKTPTLVLYSKLGVPDSTYMSNADLDFISQIVNDGFYTMSIPYSFVYQKVKSVIIHCNGISQLSDLDERVKRLNSEFSLSIEKFNRKGNKSAQYVFLPMLGLGKIKYDIPYRNVTNAYELIPKVDEPLQ